MRLSCLRLCRCACSLVSSFACAIRCACRCCFPACACPSVAVADCLQDCSACFFLLLPFPSLSYTMYCVVCGTLFAHNRIFAPIIFPYINIYRYNKYILVIYFALCKSFFAVIVFLSCCLWFSCLLWCIRLLLSRIISSWQDYSFAVAVLFAVAFCFILLLLFAVVGISFPILYNIDIIGLALVLLFAFCVVFCCLLVFVFTLLRLLFCCCPVVPLLFCCRCSVAVCLLVVADCL